MGVMPDPYQARDRRPPRPDRGPDDRYQQRDRRPPRPPREPDDPYQARDRRPPRPERGPGSFKKPYQRAAVLRHPLAVPVGGLALLAVLTPLHGLWAVQLIMAPALLIVPGIILLRALRVPGEAVATHPIYVPAASIIVLLFSGLAVDLIGPPLGLAAPLEAAPLLIALEFVCFGLLACSVSVPQETEIPWSSLSLPARKLWPLLIPLLSAAGALRLNSGHSASLAELAVVVVMIVTIAGFVFAPRYDDSMLMIGIFALGLAMLWSFSLRGDGVYGFDISNEYYAMEQTVTSGVWHVSHPNDAYGAMLSLTVLPAELHALSGIPALFILKVVYPVFSALFAVGVFGLARTILTGRWSFMAGALVIMQQTFFQQMPALARQETATLLFTVLLLTVMDATQSRATKWTFVFLLSLGVVVSHYSTAYLAITLLGIAIVFQFAASWIRRVPRITGAALLAFLVCIAGSYIWYGTLTQSTSNVSQFVQLVQGQGLDLLPSQGGGNLLQTYLQGESEAQMTPAQYEKYSSAYFKQNDPFITPLPDASDPQYALQQSPYQGPPVTSQFGSSVSNLAGLLIQQLLNLLAGLGALLLALQRKAPVMVRQIGLLGLAGMVILMLTRVSDTIAQEYNPQRAFLQMMIILAVGICWMFQRIGRRWKIARPIILVVGALSFALFFIGTSGISGIAFGGGTASNLANSGSDYQEFVKNAPDLAAAAWVNQSAASNQLIYADYYGELLLNTVAGERSGIFDAIEPETLDQHAWVYATSTNLKDNLVNALLGNESASYAFPTSFLTSNFNLVYTNGSSEVFHG